MEILMIVLLVVAVIAFYVIFLYNGVITLKNRTEEAYADIDVQLKRRYDLIPNLVSTVKGYATHEEGVFTKVTEARASAISAEGAAAQAKAENMLKDALKSLFAVVENYPELKANENFLKLQEDLKDTEDKIEAARRFYNGNVRDFNTKIQKFPNNIIAGQLGFSDFEFFEIGDEGEKEVPKVDFKKEEKKPPAPVEPPKEKPAPEPEKKEEPVKAEEKPKEEPAPEPPPKEEPKAAEPPKEEPKVEEKPKEEPEPEPEKKEETPPAPEEKPEEKKE
jgi:LemA protein